MKRSEQDTQLLLDLGYDPDDPSYTVENFGAPVTVTATQQKDTANMTEDIEKRVAQYVALRDDIKAREDVHKAAIAERDLYLEKLAGIIHRFMDEHKLENLKTAAGTCYISTRYTAHVQDADAFMRFVIENKEFDLLERRASSTATRAYVQEHNILPAGVNLNALSSVNVRRPNGKTKS